MKITIKNENSVAFEKLRNGDFYMMSHKDDYVNLYLKVNEQSYIWIGNVLNQGSGLVTNKCSSHEQVIPVELEISVNMKG